MEDEEFFKQAMKGVKPLTREQKVSLQKNNNSTLSTKARRQAAITSNVDTLNPLTAGDVELLDAYYPLSFQREGVQHGVFKKLKQGKYAPEASLDLHRMTVDRARHEVFEFLTESQQYDLRVVIIVHGKGQHGKQQEAKLKSYVNKWLKEIDNVQAFCSAKPQHGGLGAVYVQLKKSEKKKQENRERLRRGRIDTD